MSANNDADNALLPDLTDDLPEHRGRRPWLSLPVYYESRVVGTIEVHAEGPSFTYAPEWLATRGAFPLSLLMPLSPRRVPPQLFLPWAANLLPEATQLRAIGLQLGAAPEDVIGILAELGRDTAGALSIGKPGTTNTADWRPDTKRQGAGAHPRGAAEQALPRRRGRRLHVARRRADASSASPSTTRAASASRINGAPSTWILKPELRAPLRRRAERGAVPRAGAAPRPQRAATSRPARRASAPICWSRATTASSRTGAGAACTRRISARRSASRRRRSTRSNQTGIAGPTLAEMFAVTRNAMRRPTWSTCSTTSSSTCSPATPTRTPRTTR